MSEYLENRLLFNNLFARFSGNYRLLAAVKKDELQLFLHLF